MIIVHRVNRASQLRRIPGDFGVEVDLRSDGTRLILHHDPSKSGERFEEYLRRFHHRFLVVNSKCDGIEEEALRLLRHRRIRNFFFVDMPLPGIARLVARGERRIALRFSDLEPIEACLALRGRVDWLWIDAFSRFPALGKAELRSLKGFRRCLVSPELHGRPGVSPGEARRLVRRFGASAVCTDQPDRWQESLGENKPVERVP